MSYSYEVGFAMGLLSVAFHRLSRFFPNFPAAVEGVDVGVAEALEVVGGEGGGVPELRLDVLGGSVYDSWREI